MTDTDTQAWRERWLAKHAQAIRDGETVTTLNGFIDRVNEHPNRPAYATGELARLVQARLGGEPGMPVRVSRAYDMGRKQTYITFDCGTPGEWLKDMSVVADGMDDIEYALAWLEDREPILQADRPTRDRELQARTDRNRPTVAQFLERAAEIMEQSTGICHDANWNRETGTCTAVGAIHQATCDGPWTVKHEGRGTWPCWGYTLEAHALERVARTLGVDVKARDIDFWDCFLIDVPEVRAWEAAPERTKEHVAAMLRHAATLADVEEAAA